MLVLWATALALDCDGLDAGRCGATNQVGRRHPRQSRDRRVDHGFVELPVKPVNNGSAFVRSMS